MNWNTPPILCLTMALVSGIAFAGSKGQHAVRRLPEAITPLTQEHLNKSVPNFYCVDYRSQPQPGKRYWLRVSSTKWIERYPDGFESEFKALGHATVKNFPGTILVKIKGDPGKTGADNDGGLQAFIPDEGSNEMHHWYRNTGRGDTDWHDLGPMLSIE